MNQIAIDSARDLQDSTLEGFTTEEAILLVAREQLKLSIAIAESLVQIEYHTNLLCQQDNHHNP